MNVNRNVNNFKNILIMTLLLIIFLYTAYNEVYLNIISLSFGLMLLSGFLIVSFLVLKISTKRLLSYIVTIFIIEYIKESIGVNSGMWRYSSPTGNYILGVWSWVLVGLVAYTISINYFIRWIRKLNLSFPKWVNSIILFFISLLIPLTLGKYSKGIDIFFIVFYLSLLAISMYFSTKMEFCVFLGIIIATAVLGFPSEYSGSMSSGIWTYAYNLKYPPFFLIFGCWPLEILTQYTVSGYLSSNIFYSRNIICHYSGEYIKYNQSCFSNFVPRLRNPTCISRKILGLSFIFHDDDNYILMQYCLF
ncbi:hypothetical protein HY745_11125 [Candidatus Desantisbacteria bacterium]|nr:hypothetical protein [Candidatus Desantisbacteria bacterium]